MLSLLLYLQLNIRHRNLELEDLYEEYDIDVEDLDEEDDNDKLISLKEEQEVTEETPTEDQEEDDLLRKNLSMDLKAKKRISWKTLTQKILIRKI